MCIGTYSAPSVLIPGAAKGVRPYKAGAVHGKFAKVQREVIYVELDEVIYVDLDPE